MSYRQTVLDREEWEETLERSKQYLVDLGTSLIAAGKAGPVPGDHRETMLAHLEAMAGNDPGYAWWAAHVYEQAFASIPGGNPYPDMSRDLRVRMKAKKTQSQESNHG